MRKVSKAVAGSAMGNCIEWYDFGVFGFMASITGQIFFNSANDTESALATFALLAITFVIRPLGSFVFGPLGDKLGRQRMLAMTIILMSSSTFCIGLLPSWSTIGPASAVLVIILRGIQAFSAGGEYGGAATFIAEYAPSTKRGFWGSWLEFGTLGGYALGAGFVTLFTATLGDAAMLAWGWRLPFLIAGPLGLVGLWLRLKLEDTPVFNELAAKRQVERAPLKKLITTQWPSMLHLLGLVMLLHIANYVFITFLASYLEDSIGFTGNTPLPIMMVAVLGMMLLIVPIGALSDRVGRRAVLGGSVALFLVLPIPAFSLMEAAMDDRNGLQLGLGIAMLAVPLVLYLAVVAATLPAMFPTRQRYGGFAISYNIGAALFGGTASYVVTSLINATSDTMWPACYLMGAAGLALIPVLLLPDTRGKSLHGVVNSRVCEPSSPQLELLSR